MKIRMIMIACAVMTILCFFLISNNLALYNDKFDTPYELSIDLLNNLRSNDARNLENAYENTFNDGLEKKEFANEVFTFAKSYTLDKLSFDFESHKTHVYTIYSDMQGNEIDYDNWLELEKTTMDKVMKEIGFDEVNNKRTKDGLGASPETLDKFFELADQAVIETDKRMPQPKKVFEDRVTVKITSDKETLIFEARKTDTGYYLSRDFEPRILSNSDQMGEQNEK